MAKYAINDTTLTGIADAIRGKAGGTDPILVSDFATAISNISGGGADINVSYSAILPAAVTDGKIVVITSTAAPTIYFGYAAPGEPVPGDVWIHTVDTARGYAFPVGTITLKPGMTMQYNGSTWEYRDAYIGVNGVWQLFSTLSPLGSLTWGQISGLSGSDEDLSRFFNIGDTKSILIGDVAYDVEIIGMKHDDLADGSGKAGLTFCMKNCLASKYFMNDPNSNAGGWGECTLRVNLQSTIFDQLQSDLKAAIKNVTKLFSAGNYDATITSSTDTLFLLSEIEIMPTIKVSFAGEGSQYPYFTTAVSRIKKVGNSADAWWLRSPATNASTSFVYANIAGNTDYIASRNTLGIAFGFCV